MHAEEHSHSGWGAEERPIEYLEDHPGGCKVVNNPVVSKFPFSKVAPLPHGITNGL